MDAPDLAEFVSDYLKRRRVASAQEIAEAYCDTAVQTEADAEMFLAAVKEITPEVEYYLGN